MLQSDWVSISLLISGIPSAYLLLKSAYTAKSLAAMCFGLAVVSLAAGVILTFFGAVDSNIAREWGDLTAITLVLCGLFLQIRNSKPVFARFPIYMAFMPILGFLFYPTIVDSEVVKNMLMKTYEGGALIVSILLISLNQTLHKNRKLKLISTLIIALSYVLFWFMQPSIQVMEEDLPKYLFSIGMILFSIGFHNSEKTNTNPE